ncbi:MAG: alcohol dehydrogenase catalytic domain-containing protein, partial [Deltaproteobacteria bacterium]|nr:alcohol dehydrogenase catalytic domain-containing protein [Deltaproteobacteria bacterium]
MKGLVKYARGEGNVEIREVAEPFPGPGQVKIEVKAAGICGSDVHILKDDIAIPIRPPVVIGHEFSGVIAALGEGVSGWNIGERVSSETAFHVCGHCEYCRTGNPHVCKERRPIGFYYNEAFAKYIIMPAQNVHRLPENVDFIGGALCEPLSVITHGVIEISRVLPGDNVLVSGAGAIGLLAAQVARCHGARVIISGTSADENRFTVAKSLGFEELVNVEKADVKKIVAEITGGRGM